jgi:uncharacterized membrane protein YoaK (UPF0700 family)
VNTPIKALITRASTMSKDSSGTENELELAELNSLSSVKLQDEHDGLTQQSPHGMPQSDRQTVQDILQPPGPIHQCSEVLKPSANAAAPRVAGDYETFPVLTLIWVSYMCLVCGCINAVSALTYTTYLTHITGVTTRFSIGLVDSSQSARVGFSVANFFGINISYCVGALMTGFVMTIGSSDGKWTYIKLNYPNVSGWKWQHQFLLSVSMCALAAAYALMQSDLPNFPRYKTAVADGKSPAFVAATMLTTFSAALLNGFLTLGQVLVLRSAHHTGTLHDMFYFLGYSLRARNCRFIWKVKLLVSTFVSFVAGACIGALCYYSNFKNSAVIVPFIMLSPIWILGGILLSIQRWSVSNTSSVTSAIAVPSQSYNSDGTDVLASILSDINSSHCLQKIIDDDRDDDSLKTLSKIKPERIASKYDMSLDQAAAFVDHCRVRANRPTGVVLAATTAKVAGEYEDVSIKHYAWAFYVPLVGGSINAFALHGIFEQTVTHVTGLSARIGIDMAYPRPTGSAGYSADEIAAMLLAFGLSCFVCGFTLTTVAGDGRLNHLKMDYPKPLSWSWRHQLLLSLCCMYLLVAHIIVVNSTHGDKHYVDTIAISEASENLIFFEACLLCTAAAASLNCFLSQGNLVPLRASHVTGTAHDIFLGIGFSLRSRSLRVMWRVRLLSTTYIGFVVGGIIGSAAFNTDNGQYAILTPLFFLMPMWLCGCGFLCLQLRREYLRRIGLRGSRITNDNFEAASLRQA